MDYEKEYKEALERAKIWQEHLYEISDKDYADELNYIFHELKESEDEKIRKSILIGLIDCRDAPDLGWSDFGGIPIDDCIAWLEKQGEPSIKWNKNTEGNKPQVNHSVLMKTIHGIAEGEWKGGPWYQYRWSSSVKDSDVLSWIELSDI